MPFAYCKNIMMNFTEMMLLLQPIEYYELVLCEVSRLYVKKCLRKIPEKIKNLREKRIMDKTAFKEMPYFVESYQVK